MTFSTKKDLTEQFNKGLIKEVATMPLSNVGGIAICHTENGEKIFGYSSCGDKKDFFYVKLNENNSFKIGKQTYNLSNFLLVR